MVNFSPSELLDSILDAPLGISLTALLELHPGIPRRTVQRLIQQWLAEGRIEAIGATRNRRYILPHPLTPATDDADEDRFPAAIALSADSRDILAYVERPFSGRKPVGYQADFLDAYQPNKTWYLPHPLRRQLLRSGRTSRTEAPAGTYSRAILNRLLIDLSWASSHLEGNTYSRLDTRELIEHGHAATGKAAIETQMILNHKSAIEFLVENTDAVGFNRYTILNLHSLLSENLLPNPADEGRVRQHAVDIGKSVYRPLSTPQQIDILFDQFLDKAERISDPFEQSFFTMVHLPYLQPFADINKRTSRLAANIPLFRANLCPLTFLDVPEQAYSRAVIGLYELTRVELLRDLYVWAYERSTQEYLAIKQELAEPDPIRLIYRDVIKQTIHDLVMQVDDDPLTLIRAAVQKDVDPADRDNVLAQIVEELRRIHEGVLARYGLRLSEFRIWQQKQDAALRSTRSSP